MDKLLQLILKRLEREGQLAPQFAGIYDGIQSMPEGRYPAVFFWVNRSQKNAIQISVNKPLVESWLAEECRAASVKPSEMDRLATIEVFTRVALENAQPAVADMIQLAGGLANLKAVEI